MHISLNVDQARVVGAAFMAAPAMVMDELDTAMGSALLYLQGQAAENTPTAFGTLRAAYITEVTQLVDAVFGKLSNPLPYALPVELGTRPHYPPLAPLVAWVEKKLDLYGDEAEAAARGIQRKIGRVGTPGYGMLNFALIDGQATVLAEFEQAVDRIAARMAAGQGGAA